MKELCLSLICVIALFGCIGMNRRMDNLELKLNKAEKALDQARETMDNLNRVLAKAEIVLDNLIPKEKDPAQGAEQGPLD